MTLGFEWTIFSASRQEFLKCLYDDWCQKKGPKHSLIGDVPVDPTEESVATLFEPIAMVLAQFGTQPPYLSKFKAPWLMHHIFSSYHAMYGYGNIYVSIFSPACHMLSWTMPQCPFTRLPSCTSASCMRCFLHRLCRRTWCHGPTLNPALSGNISSIWIDCGERPVSDPSVLIKAWRAMIKHQHRTPPGLYIYL